MSQEIEIEFKNLLTEKEFHLLLKNFNISEKAFVTQHNDYFDTRTFALKSKGSALRIREKKETFVITLKQPSSVGLLETHQYIDKNLAEAIIGGAKLPAGEIASSLRQLNIDIKQLRHLGRLTTKRAEMPYCGGLLVFDHSFYPNNQDYELEFETSSPREGEQLFLRLLKQFDIPVRPTENKIRRLMNAISGQ